MSRGEKITLLFIAFQVLLRDPAGLPQPVPSERTTPIENRVQTRQGGLLSRRACQHRLVRLLESVLRRFLLQFRRGR